MSKKPQNQPKKRGRPPNPGRSRLKDIMQHTDIMTFLSYREFLQTVFNKIKAKEAYSYLKFAEDLGYPKTNSIWMVLTGRRSLNKGSVPRIAKALGLVDHARTYLEHLIAYENATTAEKREAIFSSIVSLRQKSTDHQYQERMIQYYAEWYHPVIRELVGLPDFQPSSNWIAKKLNVKIKPQDIEKSVKLLEDIGFIIKDSETGAYHQSRSQIMPDDDIATMSIVRYHQKMCEIARDSLLMTKASRREYNSITISLSDDVMNKAKGILRDACQKIMNLEHTCEQKDQVYQLNVHMFPFTKETH